MTIKLVAFDLDDCLFNSTGLSKRARIKGIEAMINLGLNIEKNKATKMIQEIVNEYGSNSSKHYDYFIQRLNHMEPEMEFIPFNEKVKYIAAAVMTYHEEKRTMKLFDDAEDCLVKLREMSIKTAIITDSPYPVKQYEKILRLNIDNLIDLVVISDEVGIKKPNPKLFEYCLKKFRVKGQETIYIGDRIDKDIIPAKLCSIHSILIKRGGKYDPHKTGEKIPKEVKPDYEISNLNEIFVLIEEINNKSKI